jgi:hypothetical protein
VNAGVRWDSTDWPGPSGRRDDIAPRVGLSFTPSTSRPTVIRAGLGRYFDESQLGPAKEADGELVTMTIRNPGFQGDLRTFDPYAPSPTRSFF